MTAVRLRALVLGGMMAAIAAFWPGLGEARAPYAPDAPAPTAQSCPRDTLVWVNTKSGVYHLPGMRWYGRTSEGQYICRKAADEVGYRPTHNGQ